MSIPEEGFASLVESTTETSAQMSACDLGTCYVVCNACDFFG